MAQPAKRFYKTVSVVAGDGGYHVALDDRAVTTPSRQALLLPSQKLAQEIAKEWDAQADAINPASMPLMRLAATMIDRVVPLRSAIVDGVVQFAETDLLCYRASDPPELKARQEAMWQPLLDWAAAQHDVHLTVTEGVLPVSQSLEAVAAVSKAVEAQSDAALTSLQAATQASGSVIVGLALVDRHITAEEAFAASHVDETYQAEEWGSDAEADAQRELRRGDLTAAERFLDLYG